MSATKRRGVRTRDHRPPRPSRRRRVLQRLLYAVLACLASVLAFEGGIRWTHKAFAAPWRRDFAPEWADVPLTCRQRLAGALHPRGSTLARSKLYAEMGRMSRERGIEAFAEGAKSSQGLGIADMFSVETDGKITPRLLKLDVSVRAIVIPFPVGAVSAMLHHGTVRQLERFGYSPGVDVYLQDSEMFHASIFHASHHLEEHVANADEFASEVESIKKVTRKSCPMNVVLERVAVTSSGVVVALWNAEKSSRGEPSELRRRLRESLPRAPKQQLVSDAHILHTTLARLVRLPPATKDDRKLAEDLSQSLTDELCGLELTLDRAWFVQEHHKLALALKGALDKVDMPFDCSL